MKFCKLVNAYIATVGVKKGTFIVVCCNQNILVRKLTQEKS